MQELSMHVMDIMQNSIKAEATAIAVEVELIGDKDVLEISVMDNGCGMDEATLEEAVNPFSTSRSTRGIGLGIPMIREAAVQTGGDFSLESEEGVGTVLCADFVNKSIDRQPIGDLGNVFMLNMMSHSEINFMLTLKSPKGEYAFASADFVTACVDGGGTALDAAFEAADVINSQLESLFAGLVPEMGGTLHEA